MPDGYERAQAQYDAMEPPEPYCDDYDPDEEGICLSCGCDEREHPIDDPRDEPEYFQDR